MAELFFMFNSAPQRLCGLKIIISLLCFFPAFSAYGLEVPELKGYVNDYAGMISTQVKTELENELSVFEQTDSTQIVILTIPSLEGDTIEDFGIRVGDAWKIGQKNKDNGVIFIASKQDRKMRIEVGRGLEGQLTDLMSGRIIDLVIKPRFKRGDFDGGFIAGTASLIDAVRGEFKAKGEQGPQKTDNFSRVITFLIFGGIILLFLGSISRVLGAIAGAAGLPAIIYLALMPIGLIAGIILALIGLGAGLFFPLLFSARGQHNGGGFWPGGGFHIGGSSGGSDFGGFSGGGGGFGGGGASGDW